MRRIGQEGEATQHHCVELPKDQQLVGKLRNKLEEYKRRWKEDMAYAAQNLLRNWIPQPR